MAVLWMLKTESVPPIALASLSQIVELSIVKLEFFARIIPSKFCHKRVVLSPRLKFTKLNVEVELLNLKFAHHDEVTYVIKLMGFSCVPSALSEPFISIVPLDCNKIFTSGSIFNVFPAGT